MMKRSFDVPVLLLASAVTLGYGLTMPTVTFKEMIFWKHTFSILTGIGSLYESKHYFLAGMVGFFSVVFPALKLCTLAVIWSFEMSRPTRVRLVKLLGAIGKWSMLDVFVVAVMVVVSQMSGLSEAKVRPGIYVFAFSIFCAMVATMRIERLVKTSQPKA